MVYCSKCAYQNFCYVGIKDYCQSYTPAMIAYDDKTTNTNDNFYSNCLATITQTI